MVLPVRLRAERNGLVRCRTDFWPPIGCVVTGIMTQYRSAGAGPTAFWLPRRRAEEGAMGDGFGKEFALAVFGALILAGGHSIVTFILSLGRQAPLKQLRGLWVEEFDDPSDE